LLVILFGRGLIRGLLRRLAKRTSTEFDDKFVEEIMPQIYTLVVVFVLQIATNASDLIGAQLTALLGNVYFLLYLWIGVTILWKLIDYAATWYTEQIPEETRTDAIDRTLPLLKRVAHIALIGIAISMFLNHLGIDIYVLAATLGIAGLAISLAAQDTIADMISGFVIYVDQPFRIGDRIEISGLGTWGDVVDIGTRTTRIRTRDNRLVIVPNSTIADSQVVNYTFPDPRYRVQVDIGIGYGMDIEKTRRVIIDAVRHLDGVLKDKPVDALYNEMGDSSMIFRVRWWIESYEDTRRIYDRVNTALQVALDEAGILMPNPTHDMNFRIDKADADRLSQAFHSPN
jgi:small-conductance mechanosensitive channel